MRYRSLLLPRLSTRSVAPADSWLAQSNSDAGGCMCMRVVLMALLSTASFSVCAEGRCPPGQFPVGGQGMLGCAPIPVSDGTAGAPQPAAPRPTGKWETRWGAIAEDSSNLSTGTSTSQKSKRAAVAEAVDDCKRAGGKSCKLRLAYHNQCVAVADPTMEFVRSQPKGTLTTTNVSAAETEGRARSNAMEECQKAGSGQQCSIVYSACSMSEFKKF